MSVVTDFYMRLLNLWARGSIIITKAIYTPQKKKKNSDEIWCYSRSHDVTVVTYSWLTWLVHTRAEADSFFFSFLVIIVFFCVCLREKCWPRSSHSTPFSFIFIFLFFFFWLLLPILCVCVIIGKKNQSLCRYISCPLSIECLQFSRNGMEPASFSFLFQGERHRRGGTNIFL